MSHPQKPDEIKKQFWQYRRVQLGFVVALIVGSYVLPKIPLLRGWQNKFTAASVEVAKKEIPTDAIRIKTVDEAVSLFPGPATNLVDYLKLSGPLPLAAWPCQVLSQKSLCVRYIWTNNEAITLVATVPPKKYNNKTKPFTKAGLAGWFFVNLQKDVAFSVAGPFEPNEILQILHPSVKAAQIHPK